MTDDIRNVFLCANVAVIFAMAWAYWRLGEARAADWLRAATAYAALGERLSAALAELDGLRAERETLVRRAEWLAREIRADEHHTTAVWPQRKPTVYQRCPS